MAQKNVVAKSNLNSIRDALRYAHNDLHNRKALGKDDFEKLGMTEQAFKQWEAYVDELRDTAVKFVNLTEDIEATNQQITSAREAVWREWRAVLKVGTEDEFSAGFFIRKEDASRIGHWASFTTIDTAVGRVATNNNRAEFRKRIEILIGIRMAANGMLNDDQREVIASYEGAVKTIDRQNKLLDGYGDGKDHVNGLRETLESQQAIEKKRIEQAKKYNMSEDDAADFLAGIKKSIKDTSDAIESAEKTLKLATQTRDQKKAEYDDLIAKLKTVGDRK